MDRCNLSSIMKLVMDGKTDLGDVSMVKRRERVKQLKSISQKLKRRQKQADIEASNRRSLKAFSRVVFAFSTLSSSPIDFSQLHDAVDLPQMQKYLSELFPSLGDLVRSSCPQEISDIVVANLETVKTLDAGDYDGLKIATGLIQVCLLTQSSKVWKN